MIQSNELRISNYLIDQYGDMGKVVGINSDKEYNHNGQLFVGTATLYYDNYKGSIGRWIQMLKPIKMTEEILLKFGAVKVPHKVFTNSFELPLKRNKKIVISDIGTPNFMMGIVECNFETGQVEDVVNIHNWDFEKDMYLHHFQNIYFSLTGKELEIKF